MGGGFLNEKFGQPVDQKAEQQVDDHQGARRHAVHMVVRGAR